MNKRELLEEAVNGMGESTIVADGLDSAIIGYTDSYQVVYDYDLCVDKFIKDGMTESDAIDYVEYNVVNNYVGEKTPIFVNVIK